MSELKFSQIFHNNPTMMTITRLRDGKVVDINRGALALTGYTQDEIIGKTVVDLQAWANLQERDKFASYLQQYGSVDNWLAELKPKGKPTEKILLSASLIELDQEPCVISVGVPVSAQMRAESALRQSEAQFKAVLSAIPDVLMVLNERGEYQQVFTGDPDLLTYPIDKLIGCSIKTLAGPKQGKYFFEWFQEALNDDQIHHHEYSLTLGKQVKHFLASLVCFTANGRRQVLWVARDITLRKRAEQARQQFQKKLTSHLLHTPLGYIEWSRGLLVSDWNPAAERIFGYSASEVRGHPGAKFILLPEDQKNMTLLWQRLLQHEGGERCLLRNVTKNKKTIICEWYNTPLLDDNGEVIGVASLVEDVTDRVSAEGKLRRSEERLHQAQVIAKLGSWEWDNVEKRLWCSAGYRRLFQFGLDEEISLEKILERIHPADRRNTEQMFRAQREAGTSFTTEYRVILPDGRVRYLYAIVQVKRDKKGEILRYSGTSQDITLRKQAEQERQLLQDKVLQTQKLESLGVLAGGIAHDFNNLLVGVLGNIDLVLLDTPEESPDFSILCDAKKAAKRASSLTNQMLAYSGKGAFLVKAINLNELIKDMEPLLRASVSKRASAQLHLAKELPCIDADVNQLRQIFMNLLINASDALEDNPGTIRVATEHIQATRQYLDKLFLGDMLNPGPYVVLEVQDSGVGMDEQTKEKLFDPFFSTKFTGRGLGLAAVLGIVRGHRGAIEVCSQPDAGATFRILFPVSIKSRESQPLSSADDTIMGRVALHLAQADVNAHGSRGCILVIDDEAAVRSVASRLLQRMGYEVFLAGDGGEGLELYRRRMKTLKAVFLDLTMPNISGLELLKQLRDLNSQVPVILCSGYSSQQASEEFGEKTAEGFLQKPFTVNQLQKILEETISPDTSSRPSSDSPETD